MAWSPDLVSLRMLAAVAETGSFTAAGGRLGVTQQAVSTRMRGLEQGLGLVLFDRSARGAAITATGAVVAGWAAEVLAAEARLEDGVRTLTSSADHEHTVAASLTVAEYLLPRWLAALRRERQEAGIRVTAANSRTVMELVTDGTVELGFIESPMTVRGLRSATIARDELVVVVAPEHPWASHRGPFALAELAAAPLIVREQGSGTRETLDRAFAAAGLRDVAAPLAELPTTAAITTAVAAGMGPAVLSILTVRGDLAAGRLVKVAIADQRLVRRLRAIWRPQPLPDVLEWLVAAASHAVEGR